MSEGQMGTVAGLVASLLLQVNANISPHQSTLHQAQRNKITGCQNYRKVRYHKDFSDTYFPMGLTNAPGLTMKSSKESKKT